MGPLSPADRAANTTAAIFCADGESTHTPHPQSLTPEGPLTHADVAPPLTQPNGHPPLLSSTRVAARVIRSFFTETQNLCICQEGFSEALPKSTCKYVVFFWGKKGNNLLLLVISNFLNRGAVFARKQDIQASHSCAGRLFLSVLLCPPAQPANCFPMCPGHDQKHYFFLLLFFLSIYYTVFIMTNSNKIILIGISPSTGKISSHRVTVWRLSVSCWSVLN